MAPCAAQHDGNRRFASSTTALNKSGRGRPRSQGKRLTFEVQNSDHSPRLRKTRARSGTAGVLARSWGFDDTAMTFENAHTGPPARHSRGYLPHWEAGEVAQSITFRLADSLPTALLERWRAELEGMPDEERDNERRKRIERALDSGHGSGALAKFAIGELVERALLQFDAERYRLHAWCIMPNHVHVLVTPLGERKLSSILHSWKSFTSKKANVLLHREGVFWAPEYFDRAVRDAPHFTNAVDYIAMNPVKAGLCAKPENWRFSNSWRGRI